MRRACTEGEEGREKDQNTMRKAVLFAFVGSNGTGKSTTMKRMLELNRRNLIVPSNRLDSAWNQYPELVPEVFLEDDPWNPGKKRRAFRVPDMATFTGTRVLHIDDPAQLNAITDERHGFKNGGLFLDDFRNYIPSKGNLPPHVAKIFTGRRHRMLDIFMACHAFQDLNMQLMQFEPELYVFRTTLPPNEAVEGKVAKWEALLATVERVNRKAASSPYYFERFIPA